MQGHLGLVLDRADPEKGADTGFEHLDVVRRVDPASLNHLFDRSLGIEFGAETDGTALVDADTGQLKGRVKIHPVLGTGIEGGGKVLSGLWRNPATTREKVVDQADW